MLGIIRVMKVLATASLVFFLLFSPSFLSPQETDPETQKKTKELFKMPIEELLNVKIKTAGKTAERIADIPASVVLITREDIETYGYTTLTEILQNIPGLYSINDYMKGGANFGVRGFWSGVPNDNIIFLVNDVHQVNDVYSNYPFNNILVPVEAIERIEVIRGPMSVVYGSGAFYGAINIITRTQDDNEPVNIISGSTGTLGTTKLFARAAGELENFKYSFNASIYSTDGIDKPLSEMVSDPSLLPLYYGVPEDSRTGGKMENDEKYFDFSGNFKAFFLNLSHSEGMNEIYFNLPSLSDGTYVKTNTTHVSFGFKKDCSDTFKIEGKFTYSRVREWQPYDVLFENFFGFEQFESDSYEIAVDSFFTPSSKIKITSGLFYRSVLNASNYYDLPAFGLPFYENTDIHIADDNNIVTQAVYTQVSYSPFESLRLVGGIRLEQSPEYDLELIQAVGNHTFRSESGTYARDQIEVIPRFAAIYYLNEDNIFKFLYGKAINRPSFFQNSKNSLQPDDPELDPESIQTIELNYITSISTFLNLNISIFRNSLDNLITRVVKYDEQTKEFQSWSANAGEMVTTGIELTINVEPFENFRMELSGTFQDTEDKRADYENTDVAYSPELLGYLKASYRARHLSLAVTGYYVGSMHTYWDETIGDPLVEPLRGARIGDKVDGYFVLGANLRIEDVLINGLYLNLRCSNVMDDEIRYPTFTNNQWANRGTIGAGRTFVLSIGYKF